jgi:4-carboxymuconolactone decarboxylase
MARLPDPIGALKRKDRLLYDEMVAKRGRIDGMYRSLLNHPDLTRYVSEMGSFLRFGAGTLRPDVRELVILWLARRLGAVYEWVKHEGPAKAAGLSEAVIDTLRAGQEPSDLDDIQEESLQVAKCALELRSIPEDLQDRLIERVGIKGVIELVVLVGFYRMIAGIISTFDVPLPEDAADPFG